MLSQLSISSLRNISAINIQPSKEVNFLLGDNGSGKTSIIEAIHLLALGRSFRTRTLKNVIQFGQQQFQVIAKINSDTPVGLQYSLTSGIQIRLNSAPLKKLSDLASQLPLQYISANCHQFFELGPRFRRQLVDWGVFHVEHRFNYHWQSYKKVLQQRNSALKKRKPTAEITLWNTHLSEHGEQINSYRLSYLSNLLTEFVPIFTRLCTDFKLAEVSLKYQSGWLKEQSLSASLDSSFERDRKLGYTRSGAHAADWSFKLNDADPAEMLSRGQQKLFYLALSMAQGKLAIKDGNERSILLIDDLSSELDIAHQQNVLIELKKLPVQSFISSTDLSLGELVKDEKDKVFHVEQGAIKAENA